MKIESQHKLIVTAEQPSVKSSPRYDHCQRSGNTLLQCNERTYPAGPPTNWGSILITLTLGIQISTSLTKHHVLGEWICSSTHS